MRGPLLECLVKISPRVYSEVRNEVLPADLALYRPVWKLSNQRIAIAARSPGAAPWQRYAHVGMCDWYRGMLVLLETLQSKGGGRVVTLSSQVRQNPGHWDIYRVSHLFDADMTLDVMVRLAGTKYGWGMLFQAAVAYLVGVRLLFPAPADDELNGSQPTCSGAVSRALRAGGYDPQKGLADAGTIPNHFAWPEVAEYQFTLCSTAEQASRLEEKYQ